MILVHVKELSSFCNLLCLTNNADVESLCISIDFTSFIRFQYNSEFCTEKRCRLSFYTVNLESHSSYLNTCENPLSCHLYLINTIYNFFGLSKTFELSLTIY